MFRLSCHVLYVTVSPGSLQKVDGGKQERVRVEPRPLCRLSTRVQRQLTSCEKRKGVFPFPFLNPLQKLKKKPFISSCSPFSLTQNVPRVTKILQRHLFKLVLYTLFSKRFYRMVLGSRPFPTPGAWYSSQCQEVYPCRLTLGLTQHHHFS